MVNRIADNLPPDDPPPDSWWEDPDEDDDGDGDEGPDDWMCATVRELNEVGDDLDTHLKDYAGLRERVGKLESTVGLLTFTVLAVAVLFVMHLMFGK